ncbi:nucleolar protein 9 [Aphidius gifuensis]|uniref:nucleolar protein 9 n=1 Tax=Aphidius gifuensis TaxID=684658 RepID=UPI001CDD5901|nr:nucleolar protein 9 [Aphidius gifuensis]
MSEVQEDNELPKSQGVKRKKKRSTNQMLKKLTRRRGDRGGELDSETYQYMCRIMDVLRGDFGKTSTEDKLIFANNVHEQTIGHEIDLAKNQVGAMVLDKLMKYINLVSIERLSSAFTPSLRPLCSDRFASHVIERIIQTSAERGNRKLNEIKNNDDVDVADDEASKYNAVALKLCRYVINNFEEFVWDTYANFVMRTAIECLGGLVERDDHELGKKKQVPTFGPRRIVDKEYTDMLNDTINRFLNWPQFNEFGKNELTSPLLQTFLYTLKDIDTKLCSAVIKKIKNNCFTDNNDDCLSNVFDDVTSMRLIEACLTTSNQKMFKKLYKKFFAGNIKKILDKNNANYSVQRLLDACTTKEDFELIFDEISVILSDILSKQYTGVLSSLANACLRLQSKQGPFLNILSECLGCDGTVDSSQDKLAHFVDLVVRLINWEQYESAKKCQRVIPLHLHGSLIIQAILQFNKPIKVVNSLLAMNGSDLAILFGEPKGSRILDAFMDSKFIGEKSRDKLIIKLKGNWLELARGTHGSRCIDKVWLYTKNNQKNQIMEELSANCSLLTSTKAGSIISAKLNVPLFARNKKDWADSQGKENKTKALFADIIGPDTEKSTET